MSYASDDLTPLLLAAPGPGVGFRQGVVTAWDQETAENTVEVAGATLTDLPILNTSEALLLEPGAVVGILTAGSSWFIMGRITVPGTPDAASALTLVSRGVTSAFDAAEGSRTSTTYGDLDGANVGPSVEVTVGESGKCLAFFSAQIGLGATTPWVGGFASVALSGATTVAALGQWACGATIVDTGLTLQITGQHLFEGLNPGLHTATMKYAIVGTSVIATFRERRVTVFAL